MNLVFSLSMPGNNSWNGKWSGDGKPYLIVKNYRKEPLVNGESLIGKSFGYNFGDGWYANVSVREAENYDAKKLRKLSAGFCGYDWMVDSILKYGKIYASHNKPEEIVG